MGYVPPVKDEQMMIYGQRQTSRKPMIIGPSPAERIEFFDALKDQSKQRYYFERNESKQRLLKIARMKEKELTGKGEMFDSSI
ncbi:hypothetical protein CR194_09920 [Salipaludibacillus keqinensis]|uniref:Uncharacterized protein n=1 Tax=Salipaludibacillus keqinensis TaxID=2045207 RepID=A0A323TEN1_9BACI|nr:hypothetical protein [Salipaludibacillus keqinensis]PYZ93478.1 hypothetical protein CR194_09920 [Salipaludibacillus keqinensis]